MADTPNKPKNVPPTEAKSAPVKRVPRGDSRGDRRPLGDSMPRPTGGSTSSGGTGLAPNILFYCKDCHKISPVNRLGRRYVYTCTVCGTKNVAFGTHRSLTRYFRIKEEEVVEGEEGKTEGAEKAEVAEDMEETEPVKVEETEEKAETSEAKEKAPSKEE
ncbi:MAG: hypothetical protein Q8P27_01835, partial [Candidatus Peregrinibacteria bacterium]|nr:hypothetical protein [Candidatus Peregrinibacteria bacterium]